MSLFNSSLSRHTTGAATDGATIQLKDNTAIRLEEPNEDNRNDELDATTPEPGISKKTTRSSMREELARRKYRKYQEDKYKDPSAEDRPRPAARTSTAVSFQSNVSVGGDQGAVTPGAASSKDVQTPRRREKLRRALSMRKRPTKPKDGDAMVDVLYENQRGSFFFGMPLYSSQSLLNFDPPAWTTADGEPSIVNIANAQVPDPSWEWAWKNWYVDMSRDVDEQGWEYSFMFQKRFPWHGTHPWLYSFVRRRRWLRKRVRRHRHLPDGRVEGGNTMKEAHRLNADYFTIHPARDRSPDSTTYEGSTAAPSLAKTATNNTEDDENEDPDTLQVLFRRLRKAKVDREKINVVLQFMDRGGEDVYYLADEMPRILSLFIFQHSRRRLLAAMVRTIDAAAEHRKSHGARDEPEGDGEKRRIDNLLRAIRVADEQIQGLEFWSDIKDMAEEGETVGAVDEEQGWAGGWTGLDLSGPGRVRSPGEGEDKDEGEEFVDAESGVRGGEDIEEKGAQSATEKGKGRQERTFSQESID